ncbi:hypothetical protein [Prosthecomicrobium pneumaticum]|uniref:CheY-like chemotaxis protein n=1 Tax=Prosthecomicrobium pneumaticum TaxID=81895 RepID=A0A7W9FL46_9HYPH|nr:hypothetical protein [Prosthecomicrobium pneumaticum]MBB5752353.1 CheY-like chemotaxis protein [Prosthecomicrobium pneumaticum]
MVEGAALNIDFHQLSFLLVEDNGHLRAVLRGMLEGFGVLRIEEAADGATARAALAAAPPAVLVLDRDLADAALTLDAARAVAPPPALILLAGEGANAASLGSPGVTVLAKPVSARAFHEALTALFGGTSAAPPGSPAEPAEGASRSDPAAVHGEA